jgi:Putative MetA-pathway of phenol degradation
LGRSPSARAVLLAASLSAAVLAAADEPPVVADRPGFGESASAVPPRHVQVEVGATWAHVDGATSDGDFTEALLRVGLAKEVELRVVAPDYFRSWGDLGVGTGWTDMAVGVKGHVAAGENELALRGTVYLPTGSPNLSSSRVDPELAVAWSRDLSKRWSAGATVGERWLRKFHQRLTSPSASVGLGLSPRWSTFLEYGGNFGRGVRPVHRLDHGYTWSPTARSQLDASIGIALSPAAPDFFVEAGYVRRF